LTLNSISGIVSGTPTTTGNFTAVISATNAGGNWSAQLTIRVLPPAPVITSANNIDTTVGAAFNYRITASNNATSYGASGLPAGLTLNASTGVIGGTPGAAGNFTANLSATNAGGTGRTSLAIQILPRIPAITSAVSANATVGSPFSYRITASNNATSYGASGLPAGFTLNASTGVISGTPGAAGNFTATIWASNAAGIGISPFILRVAAQTFPPSITSALSARGDVWTAFHYRVTASNNPTSFGAIGLPIGLTINSTTGSISGYPSARGNSTVQISARNAAGTSNATLSISIAQSPFKPMIKVQGGNLVTSNALNGAIVPSFAGWQV
jgi:hypothetical protein